MTSIVIWSRCCSLDVDVLFDADARVLVVV